ncbi:MAG: copper homeostasis protein CutC [Bacteroidota bacterium]
MVDPSDHRPLLEACVESFAQAQIAQQRGAHRLELCADLSQGGLTPARQLVRQCIRNLDIPVKVIIRPRGGDFVHPLAELQQMQKSIHWCLEEGVQGLVLGILEANGQLNLGALDTLVEVAGDCPITIHKAIDVSAAPLEEVKRLCDWGRADAILTSGAAPTAWEGREMLKAMIKMAGTAMTIIAAGRITDQNLEQLHQHIGASEYHGRKIVGELS